MGISVVMLAYKEAENLKILLPRINSVLFDIGVDSEVIIIDSAKPLDDTENVCKTYNAKYINQEEPHYAGAFRTGIKYATHERMLILDADGSHEPEKIKDIYDMSITGYDLVIGSRYVKGGVTNDSKSSILMSKILNTVMRIAIGVKAKDISTSFRMYITKDIKAVKLVRTNYDVLQEVILKLKINKGSLKIGETPITFVKRMNGESKRKLMKFIFGYIGTLFMLLGMNIKSKFKK